MRMCVISVLVGPTALMLMGMNQIVRQQQLWEKS
jgi:hypothetical protein